MQNVQTHFTAVKISNNVYWVGAIDWELRDFHGYKTTRGSTYNAFLIMDAEPILIDTVKAPFLKEMLARIKSIVDPKQIKYIISNHAEMDHSGCLPEMIDLIKPKQVFASKTGVKDLNAHFKLAYQITAVENAQELVLGGSVIKFVETKMLHWPDSMFSFYKNDGILFSQDGFGMHLATAKLFVEENNQDIVECESAKYFANILLPYSSFVTRLLNEFGKYNLNIKMIAPDHGPLWRRPEDIQRIISLWGKWAKQEPTRKIVIVYDTMWKSTAAMAHSIADGAMTKGVAVEVLPLSGTHRSDIATEILTAGALVIGSPTLNGSMFPTVADTLCYIKGLRPVNLVGQTFGSYGWGGEATKEITEILTKMHVKLIGASITAKYVPAEAELFKCRQLGEEIANYLIANIAATHDIINL